MEHLAEGVRLVVVLLFAEQGGTLARDRRGELGARAQVDAVRLDLGARVAAGRAEHLELVGSHEGEDGYQVRLRDAADGVEDGLHGLGLRAVFRHDDIS